MGHSSIVQSSFFNYNVLKEIFPDAQLKCCRFHLAEAWWGKIQSVGLSNEYKNTESQLGKWLKWFFGLHFVDAVEVEDIFVDLMSVAPDGEKCITFADYLVENYVSNDSKFPPSLWAEIPSDEKRTNNAAESYHANLNEQFYSPHPTIFVFRDVVQKLQSVSYVKIRGSDTQFLTRRAEREKHQFLMRQYNKLLSGEIDRSEYVRSLGYRYSASF
jgi:hypothetical protein